MDNIAIIITKLNGGGAERCASNLSIELSKKYKVFLIVFDGSNITYPYKGKLINLSITDSSNIVSRSVNVIRRVYKLRKLKKKYNIKCSISLLDGPNIVNVLSKRKDKIIISVRNRLSRENMGRIRRALIKFCSKKANVTVALSKMVKKDLIDEFNIDGKKIVTIYNHCDPALLHKLAAETTKPNYINDENVYITTMGRLNYQKGQWHLIRAFSKVVNEIENAYLIIIGAGELEERLKKLAKDLNVESHIIFTGYIKNPHKILEYSEMFVFPSLYEGLGNVLLEALAFNKAIISTDCVAGPREILAPNTSLETVATEISKEKYGILIPPLDDKHFNSEEDLDINERNLAKAIVELHKNELLRHSYEENARERIADFSKENIMYQWIKCIEND